MAEKGPPTAPPKRKYKSGAQKRREKFEATERASLQQKTHRTAAVVAEAPPPAAPVIPVRVRRQQPQTAPVAPLEESQPEPADEDIYALERLERADYAISGKPPNDAVSRMIWVQGLMAKVIYWSGRHIGTAALHVTRRTILEGGAKLGMTANKALYEQRLKKLEALVYGKRRKGEADGSEDGLEDLEAEG